MSGSVSRFVTAGVVLFGATASGALAVESEPSAAIPNLSLTDFGWVKTGTTFLPPASGQGPISYDKVHPIIVNSVNARGGVVTGPLRVADLNNPVLKPWVVEQMRKADAEVIAGKDRYSARADCRPGGVPQFLIYGGLEPLYFIQTPKVTLIVNQAGVQIRHVYMNVPHSPNPKVSWYGESVGHYEGDELVVDTIAINDKSTLDDYGTPHTSQLHVVERFKVIEGGKTLQASFTLDDPGAFNAPWSGVALYHRSPDEMQLTEEACAENNTGHSFNSYNIPVAEKPDF